MKSNSCQAPFDRLTAVLSILLALSLPIKGGGTMAWRQCAKLPMPMTVTAFVIQGKIYALNLESQVPGEAKRIYCYDPAADCWTGKAAMPAAKDGFATVCCRGRIYTLGGQANIVEEYDPATDHWTRRSPLPMLAARSA